MTLLHTARNLAQSLDREERLTEARKALGRGNPHPDRERRSSSRPDALLGRLRARLTLLTLWATRNAPAIRETAHRAKGSALNYGGALLVGYGVWLAYPPAGFIVGGILAWVLQWSGELDGARRQQ